MTNAGLEMLDRLHHEALRDPTEIMTQWQAPGSIDPRVLEFQVQGQWWDVLHTCGLTLLLSREYEHLLLACCVAANGEPRISFLRVPHPSGMTVDRQRNILHVASTRNPNQLFDLMPVTQMLPRLDAPSIALEEAPLIPVRSQLLPGSLYLHDLAMIDGELYGNAVGHNAVVKIRPSGGYERIWWPKCIETDQGPVWGQNYLQLNSIAAGENLATSFFSASSAEILPVRPGDPNFPVDRRGVIFSGATREVIAGGLTRPHSARLHQGRLWVDNSGYGEVGWIESGVFTPLVRLPGWTRGLCFYEQILFVGTSRVLPRFYHYAPGLKVAESVCGIHAIHLATGQIVGSLLWPYGNQIFALEWVSSSWTRGFPYISTEPMDSEREKTLFYAFDSLT